MLLFLGINCLRGIAVRDITLLPAPLLVRSSLVKLIKLGMNPGALVTEQGITAGMPGVKRFQIWLRSVDCMSLEARDES